MKYSLHSAKYQAGFTLAILAVCVFTFASTTSALRGQTTVSGLSECIDGLDNDNDGLSDYGDPGCHEDSNIYNFNSFVTGRAESSNLAVFTCSDGIDNDGDGLIDADDPVCHPRDFNRFNADSYYHTTDELRIWADGDCGDGKDNNGNGLIDIYDKACHYDGKADVRWSFVHSQWEVTTECNDGKDNDKDGFMDENDPGCYTKYDKFDPDSFQGNNYSYQESLNGTGTYTCIDGKDNNGDGLTDSQSPTCHTDGNPANRESFMMYTSEENAGPCLDGKDNDGDGLSDINDPGCHYHCLINEYKFGSFNFGALSEQCSRDGVDLKIENLGVSKLSNGKYEILFDIVNIGTQSLAADKAWIVISLYIDGQYRALEAYDERASLHPGGRFGAPAFQAGERVSQRFSPLAYQQKWNHLYDPPIATGEHTIKVIVDWMDPSLWSNRNGIPDDFFHNAVSEPNESNNSAEIYTWNGTVSTKPVCGDGKKSLNENCDDGNTASGDGCSATCTIETGFRCDMAGQACVIACGDGLKMENEVCDDGNAASGDGCSSVCTLETGYTCEKAGTPCSGICGDGVIAKTEQCDDGNKDFGDGCDASCNIEGGHICEGAKSLCLPNCGDGWKLDKEACDDGNKVSGDGCTESCQPENGFTCAVPPGSQKSTCTPPCGNGIVDNEERCDDGNRSNGDGCSSICITETGYDCSVPAGEVRSKCLLRLPSSSSSLQQASSSISISSPSTSSLAPAPSSSSRISAASSSSSAWTTSSSSKPIISSNSSSSSSSVTTNFSSSAVSPTHHEITIWRNEKGQAVNTPQLTEAQRGETIRIINKTNETFYIFASTHTVCGPSGICTENIAPGYSAVMTIPLDAKFVSSQQIYCKPTCGLILLREKQSTPSLPTSSHSSQQLTSSSSSPAYISSSARSQTPPTSANPPCSDGLDNDGDGKADYPSDPGCVDANDKSEYDAATVCSEEDSRVACMKKIIGTSLPARYGQNPDGSTVVSFAQPTSIELIRSIAINCRLDLLKPGNFVDQSIQDAMYPRTSSHAGAYAGDCNRQTIDAYEAEGRVTMTIDGECNEPYLGYNNLERNGAIYGLGDKSSPLFPAAVCTGTTVGKSPFSGNLIETSPTQESALAQLLKWLLETLFSLFL